jgi:hypothetical protein
MSTLAVVPASATTAMSAALAGQMLAWTNADRTAAGLRGLVGDPRLAALAEERAAAMAAAGRLSHDLGPSVVGAQNNGTIRWYSTGENIGFWSGGPSVESAAAIYAMFERSPSHWTQIMSATYNYVGIGFAEREANGSTYVAMVFAEMADHTRPIARNTTTSRSGTTITFRWTGSDLLLQTHSAGVRDFDVQYRMDLGSWRLIRDNTTSRYVTLTSRPRGHDYWVRVRARDRAGNLSAWSTPQKIRVP